MLELISRNTIQDQEHLLTWQRLTGIGIDGKPFPQMEKHALYYQINRALRAGGLLNHFPEKIHYGTKSSQQREQISLQLCNLWIQRLLFCHQLECKLIRIHGQVESYRFLQSSHISSWQQLEDFFLRILPQPIMFRQVAYSFVPPVDIPLFELHQLEVLLPLGKLDSMGRKLKVLLKELLDCLTQLNEHSISCYRLQNPVPEQAAHELSMRLLDNWYSAHEVENCPPPTLCDPIMYQANMLIAATQAWMRKRYGNQLPAYQVTAGLGGFNRHVPHKIQQLHETFYQELSEFVENQVFGVAPDMLSLSWSRLQIWAFLLDRVPFDATTSYELFFPLPSLRHKLSYGAALVSQYRTSSSMRKMLKGNKLRLGLYCSALDMYQTASSEKEREEARGILEDMQKNFRTKLQASHPDFQRLKRLEKELHMMATPLFMLESSAELAAKEKVRKQRLKEQIERLRAKVNGVLRAHHSFEWRFHFPEILDPKDAHFIGFDMIMLHPKEACTPEEEIGINQALSLSTQITKPDGFVGIFLPDTFKSKFVFQKGRKIVFEQFETLDRSYCDGQGFEELCTGKTVLTLQMQSEG